MLWHVAEANHRYCEAVVLVMDKLQQSVHSRTRTWGDE